MSRFQLYEVAVIVCMAVGISDGAYSTPKSLPNIKAAVVVPGFLTGANEFQELVGALNDRGIPTISVPMPNWHWIPCLGGRSARPMLERIDFAVKHLAASGGDPSLVPNFDYNLVDLWNDVRKNPGGLQKIGGTDKVDEYPVVDPHGTFPHPDDEPQGKIALIGHSAGGWISRAYLSSRNYGGKVYGGTSLVHSLVTLGTPHVNAPGPAFEGIAWCNREEEPLPIRQLAVGGVGYKGGDWGALTQGSYDFCSPNGDGTSYDGDGVTPIQSALALPGAEQMVISDVTHFCWSDTFGGDWVSRELYEAHKDGAPWYGSDGVIDQWGAWLDDVRHN